MVGLKVTLADHEELYDEALYWREKAMHAPLTKIMEERYE